MAECLRGEHFSKCDGGGGGGGGNFLLGFNIQNSAQEKLILNVIQNRTIIAASKHFESINKRGRHVPCEGPLM